MPSLIALDKEENKLDAINFSMKPSQNSIRHSNKKGKESI